MNPIIRLRAKARWLSKQQDIKLKDALQQIAIEEGYSDWKLCKNALDTFWYQKPSAYLNHWFAKHAEAEQHKDIYGGYLLTYKGQYFVASKDYIEHIGFSASDPIWGVINYDVSTSNALEKFHAYYAKSINKRQYRGAAHNE